MVLYDSLGRPVQLAEKLGEGGEGTVFKLASSEKYVAKLYKEQPAQDRVQKLLSMLNMRGDTLAQWTAWPVEVLRDQPQSTLRGYIMPNVRGFKDVHQLYSPKS